MLLFLMLFFFEFRAKYQIIFLPNQQNLEEYFHRGYLPSSILMVNLCTSRRTQLQQRLEMSVSFVILR